jgi:hypothetical protein
LVWVEIGLLDCISDTVVQVEPRDAQLLAAILIDKFDCRLILLGSLEVLARDVVTEDATRQVVVFEERSSREPDK